MAMKTKAPARKRPERDYKIIITMMPAKGRATIRVRGKTTTLSYPEQGWESGPVNRIEAYRGVFIEPSWTRFYIQGTERSQRSVTVER